MFDLKITGCVLEWQQMFRTALTNDLSAAPNDEIKHINEIFKKAGIVVKQTCNDVFV